MKLNIVFSFAICLGLILAVTARDVRNLKDLEIQETEERKMEKSEMEKKELEESEMEEKELEESAMKEKEQEEKELEESEMEERGLAISEPQEREITPGKNLKKFVTDKKGELGELGKNIFGAGAALIKIDYTQSAGQIAWQVAEAIMPVIGAALAFIPVVGPIVSGIFLGVWSIISAIWGPKEENPMEKMINEMATKLRKEMDEKLSNVINLAIYGEISRNSYICNKYNYISDTFAENYKNNVSLETTDSIHLKLYLNDCDNFLKDTAEAFVYDDYADVLWVAGAISTSVRLGFLTEVIKNGRVIGFTDDILLMYIQELKNDTTRQFEYHTKGYKKQYKDLLADRKEKQISGGEYQKGNDYLEGISEVELASCTLQGQFFYFDRELYPLGIPKNTTNDIFYSVAMQGNVRDPEPNEYQHLQVFFKVSSPKFSKLPKRDRNDPYLTMEYLNCFLGPIHLTASSIYYFIFHPAHERNMYSYEFRVMYLDMGTDAVPVLSQYERPSDKFNKFAEVYRTIQGGHISDSEVSLHVEFIFPENRRFNESVKLIDIPANPRWKECPFVDTNMTYCKEHTKWLPSRFKMNSVGTFNYRDEELTSFIAIEEPRSRSGVLKGFLVGMEIIMRSINGNYD